MTDRNANDRDRMNNAADWFVALDADADAGNGDSAGGDGSGGGNVPEFDAWIEASAEHADAISRCAAAVALTPRLAAAADVAWAFDEASRIARTPPRTLAASSAPVWYRRPGPAWATAAISAAVAIAALSVALPPQQSALPVPEPVGANVTVAPIVVSAEIARLLAEEVEPVVLIANQVAVDGRSIVVLPFSGSAGSDDADSAAANAAAKTLYDQVLRQLTAYPGLYLIEPRAAAAFANAGHSPREIALYLGVRGVVQGQVSTADGAITLELQFTDAARDGLAIDASYRRPVADVALLRNDITESLIDALAAAQISSSL